MYKHYYAPGTCALGTHNALEETGAPYEAVLVDFRKRRGAKALSITAPLTAMTMHFRPLQITPPVTQ
jgi:hypothetical protein